MIRDFKKSLGNRTKLSLAHITPKDIFTYRDSITKTGRTPRTANISIKVVSAAFNAALRQGYITNNPCTALEGLRVESVKKGTFTPDQVFKLVEAAQGDWKGAILLALLVVITVDALS